jgi:hypothetical protein
MHLPKKFLGFWKCPLLLLLAAPLLSAAEAATTMVIVADSRKFHGLRLWWANLYNDNHLHFALMTVVLVPLAGAFLGTLADIAMGHLGIDLKSRALREG